MNLKVVGQNLLVELEGTSGDRVTQSGLYMPSTTQEGIVKGTVIEIGNEVRTVMKSHFVWFAKMMASEVKIEGKTYYVLAEPNVLTFTWSEKDLPF